MNLYSSCNLIADSDMASIVDSLVAPLSVINALKSTHRVTRKADADNHIILANAHHLLKKLARAVCRKQAHILKHQIHKNARKLARGAQLLIPTI